MITVDKFGGPVDCSAGLQAELAKTCRPFRSHKAFGNWGGGYKYVADAGNG